MRTCREFIKENSNSWEDRKEGRRRERVEMDRREQKHKAECKKQKFLEKQGNKEKMQKIKEMLCRIPEVESERIEREVRKEENLVLAEIRKNL